MEDQELEMRYPESYPSESTIKEEQLHVTRSI